VPFDIYGSKLSGAVMSGELINLVVLSLVALSTSAISGTFGLGGGVILLLVMPGLVPISAVIPVHAYVQFFSNASRVAFDLRHIAWHIIIPFTCGSVVGALLGAQWADWVSLDLLPLFAGLLILVVTWVPIASPRLTGKSAFVILGFYQTGLGMLAGGTGPLGAAVLSQHSQQRDWLVVNTGLYMMINHGVRVIAFGLLGVGFAAWWQVIGAMSAGSIAGSWLGTQLRKRVPAANFFAIFRWVITLLALRMVWIATYESVL
jgi:uncharacterized membrane protein YfcA